MAAIGKAGLSNVARFFATTDPEQFSRYTVSGVTRDYTGTALGGCAVELYETLSNLFRGDTISDANGNYAIEVSGDRTIALQAIAYKPGSPDLAGITANTLIAS